MRYGFKTELNLNDEQPQALSKHVGTARHIWHWELWLTQNTLNHNPANPAVKLQFPSGIDQPLMLVMSSDDNWNTR
jgi:Helix-turn-helix domain